MRKYYQRRLPEDPSKDYYYIMRLTPNAQTVLVEYGFIDNANDQKKLEDNLLNYVEGVVKALTEYSGYNYVPPIVSVTENYQVKKGDTLYSIAAAYNSTVNNLKSLNKLTTDTLSVGQILKVPALITSPSEDNTYIVKKGDTLYAIASQYNISVDDIKKANNLTSNTLHIGEILIIPQITKEEIYYTVVKGDSLYGIATKYNITVDDLIKANNLDNIVLSIGQQLIIPNQDNLSQETIYVVLKGDSLYSVAKKFNKTVDEIKQKNNLTTNLLTIGQQLIIPN